MPVLYRSRVNAKKDSFHRYLSPLHKKCTTVHRLIHRSAYICWRDRIFLLLLAIPYILSLKKIIYLYISVHLECRCTLKIWRVTERMLTEGRFFNAICRSKFFPSHIYLFAYILVSSWTSCFVNSVFSPDVYTQNASTCRSLIRYYWTLLNHVVTSVVVSSTKDNF